MHLTTVNSGPRRVPGKPSRRAAGRFPFVTAFRPLGAVLFLLLVSPLVTLNSSLAHAQSESASLSGTIVDRQGALVPDAEVSIVNMDTNVAYQGKTNGAGVYNFPFLAPGPYRILVSKQGFKQIDLRDITLHTQDSVNRNFTLEVGGTSETITVRADQNNINTTDATVSTTIDRNFAENLPLNGRSFQTLLQLTPGMVFTGTGASSTSGQFSINGQRTNANYFVVDGVSANVGINADFGIGATFSGSLPGLTATGGTNSLASVDDLEEFKVQTSTYSAEFGRSPGGQVSVVTRSGTNSLHGNLFDYFRNEALDANNWFNDAQNPPLAKARERQNDFGGTLGGPILKDRTFFFISYEGLRLEIPESLNSFVPALSLRAAAAPFFQPILNSFPIPTGPELVDPVTGLPTGVAPLQLSTSSPGSLDVGSIRIDHKISDRVSLFGRFSESRSFSGSTGVNTLTNSNFDLKSLTVGSSQAVRSNLSNDVRFNYSSDQASSTNTMTFVHGATPFDPTTLLPSFASAGNSFSQTAFFVGGQVLLLPFGLAIQNVQHQLNITDTASYTVGRHSLKFGVDGRRLRPTFEPAPYQQIIYEFSNQDIMNGVASLLQVTSAQVLHPRFMNLSLFVQDTWRLSSRFTLDYGLRWELNPVPGEVNGMFPLNVLGLNNPATATLAPLNSPPYKTHYTNFAPRIGFAYELSNSTAYARVLRGGFGLFYDLGNDLAVAGYRFLPFSNSTLAFAVPTPIPENLRVAPPLPAPLTPPYPQIYAFDPNLNLPYTLQWNASIEQALGHSQSFSMSYVASSGKRLIRQDNLFNFSQNFGEVFAVRNAASSNYQSLQLQFNRRLSHGLQALASYTYSHSIDDASSSSSPSNATQEFFNPNIDRGSSDFDVRHSFSTAITYDFPGPENSRVAKALLSGWSVDTIFFARTGLPVDLIGGFFQDAFGTTVRPDLVPDEPLYLYGTACKNAEVGTTCPGGRGFNPAAFLPVPTDTNGNPLRQGTLRRNVIRGFGMWQDDLALRRQFNLGERLKLQFRGEFFNIFNHPNFGQIDNSVGSGTFGRALSTLSQSVGSNGSPGIGLSPLYSQGGPRSGQLALKLIF